MSQQPTRPTTNPATNQGVVMILDDDPSVLAGLARLLSSHGYVVMPFREVGSFLDHPPPEQPCCLILDNHLNAEMTGLEVHAELQRRNRFIPTVFLTAYWNVQSVVSAMRAGADGFLTKPFDPAELLDEVALALARARDLHDDAREASLARERASHLTSREEEIVRLVLAGRINKEIAEHLDLALVTVKVHRARAMQKLAAGNAAELARFAALAGIRPAE